MKTLYLRNRLPFEPDFVPYGAPEVGEHVRRQIREELVLVQESPMHGPSLPPDLSERRRTQRTLLQMGYEVSIADIKAWPNNPGCEGYDPSEPDGAHGGWVVSYLLPLDGGQYSRELGE